MVSKKERKRRRLEQQKKVREQIAAEQEERYKKINTKNKKSNKNFKIAAFAIAAIVLVLVVFGIVSALKPGVYDDFAKCLTEKGAVMYGEDWCQYTNGQKNMFGKSFKYIDYEEKQDLNLRPTWIINGKKYEKVQSFERLATLTGCEKYLDM